MSLAGFRSSNHPQQVAKRGATNRDDLGTDPALFDALNKRFGFTLDVAASHANAKCERYFTKDDCGLTSDWTGQRVWCNPPYSQIRLWVEKAWEQCHNADLIVMLLPANRPEQGWWQDLVEPHRDHGGILTTEFIRGRQRFVMPGAEAIGPNERPPFGCVLLIWEAGPGVVSPAPDPTDDQATCPCGNATATPWGTKACESCGWRSPIDPAPPGVMRALLPEHYWPEGSA